MNKLLYKPYYERHLPHYQPPGSILFITFRLAGSLPKEIIRELLGESKRTEGIVKKISDPDERRRQVDLYQRKLFGKYDQLLGLEKNSPAFLKDPQIAGIIQEYIKSRNGNEFELHALCIMPNHVHIVFKPLEKDNTSYYSLANIMHAIKGYTARQANLILNREGPFWQHESYDHVVRDEGEWKRIIEYIAYNPVKAGFVERWQDWKWTYTLLTCL